MILALFIWVVVIILSLSFLFSYLLWSPRSKSPYVIALEVMEVSSLVSFSVGAFTIFLGAVFTTLALFQLFQSL